MTDQRWTIRSGSVPALFWPDDENPDMPFSFTEADLAEMLPDALDRQVSAMFAALADALRAAERDAKVAAAVKWRQEQDDDDDTADMVAMAMVISAHMAAP